MNSSAIYGIFGAGGFGREVMPIAYAMLAQQGIKKEQIVFIDDADIEGSVNGHAVLSRADFFKYPAEFHYFNVAVGDSKAREEIVSQFLLAKALPFSIHCLSSMNLSHNQIGDGAILSPYTVITANAKIGKFFQLNIYSYVAHDCIVGDFVTFAPKVQCNGGVVIEDHAYIGTGAIIRNSTPTKKIIIGQGAVVGMGAVVTKSVPASATVVGNPAVILKRH